MRKIGVDLRARHQTIEQLDTEAARLVEKTLEHERTQLIFSAASAAILSPSPATKAEALTIPGIDTATALKRTGRDRKRYESFLSRFAESQTGAIGDIRNALAANDSPTAERIAHSLKGSAANLGAKYLSEAAARAEAAIDSRLSVSSTIEELSHALEETIRAIRSALPGESQALSQVGTADPSTVAQPLAQLKRLLEADDGTASDFILGAQASLSKVLSPTEIEVLAGQVANFAYADALQTLSSIAARISLNLE